MNHPSIVERISNASLPTKPDEASIGGKTYNEARTPDIEGGAMRPGGAPNLYSKENIGVLAQFAALGVIYGTLLGVVYPFLNNYLRMTGTETSSASALLALPWTFRVFVGIVSDCYPIYGYRRRPYIVIGWLVCFVACFIMAVIPIGEPKYPDPALAYIPEANLTKEQLATINYDAPSSGVKYILLLVLANIGCVISVTVANGTLVDLAQREPENIRGTAQTMSYCVQEIFQCISTAMIGFGMNSTDYGGTFSSAMGFNAVMGVCAFFSLVIIPFSWYYVPEEKAERQSMRAYFSMLYDLIQQRVVYQIIAFRFFRNIFSWFYATATYPIQSLWAKVTPVNNSFGTILGYAVAAVSFYLTKKYGLGWSWRSMIVITQLAVIAIDLLPSYFTIWDVYRSQWFWLSAPIVGYLPYCIGYAISTFAMIEFIDVGTEAGVSGLIMTVSTLASPFSTVVSKYVCAFFDIDYEYLQLDNSYVRTQVTYVYTIGYALKLFSLVFVFLLPRQKAETQELKRTGGKSLLFGNLTIVYLVFAFCWSLMTNLMSFSSKTSCLKIAGGSGCD